MARIVVIFVVLSAFTAAMFWFARHLTMQPASTEAGPVVTVPVEKAAAPAPSEAPKAASGSLFNPAPDIAKALEQSAVATVQTGLVVERAEAGPGDTIVLEGRADPGATLKVSVDGKRAGEVVVGGNGAWSLTTARGPKAEPKVVLELANADGTFLDKTDFVFRTLGASPFKPEDKGALEAQATAPADKTKAEASEPPPATEVRSLHVRRGESLWRIARRTMGGGRKWKALYAANRDVIGSDPDFIRPGTRLVIPS